MTEDLTPKVVDILRVVVPKPARIAVHYNPANPSNKPMLERIQGSIEKSAARFTLRRSGGRRRSMRRFQT